MPRTCGTMRVAIGDCRNGWRVVTGSGCRSSRRSGSPSTFTRRRGARARNGRPKRLAVTTWRFTNASARCSIALPMSAVAEVLDVLRRVLDGHGLRWFVFGAQAVAVRGAPRATQDIDVTVQVERARLRSLVEALESEGLRHRYPERAEELVARGTVVPFIHPSGMEVDLVPAGRGKDLDDLCSLLESGDVNLEEARDLLDQLEEALGQSDLLPRLENAVRAIEKGCSAPVVARGPGGCRGSGDPTDRRMRPECRAAGRPASRRPGTASTWPAVPRSTAASATPPCRSRSS